MDLRHTHIAIFGAYGLIGAALSRAFAGAGSTLRLIGRDEGKLVALRDELGGEATTAAMDLRSIADARAVLQGRDRYAAILTPIGGPAPMGPIASAEPDEVVEAMRAKLLAQWSIAAAAKDALDPEGSLILFSGLLARKSFPGMNAMGTVNAAVEAMTRALADELAPLRVNCISPAMVKDDADPARGEATPSAVADMALGLVMHPATSGMVIDVPRSATLA